MTILDKIVENKRSEVEQNKKQQPLQELEKSPYFERKTFSLGDAILGSKNFGIIAEFKRKSPSKGFINENAQIKHVIPSYEKAGACAISILTDLDFFGGKNEDLTLGRELANIPILRKDFIIDPYQIFEAKSIGADAILLISSILSKEQVNDFAKLAKKLNLSVLFEVHDLEEIDKVSEYVDVVGVNNRNLKSFEVSIETSIALSKYIPGNFVKISESGIRSANDIHRLKNHGFSGFLVGESFMTKHSPGDACKEFLLDLFS